MTFLVDTNVISELARPRPDPGVVVWAQSISHFSISAVTHEEIQFGLSWKPNTRLATWWTTFLEKHCTVLPIDSAIARSAGQMRGILAATGRPRTQADMLIAATALVAGLTVVTRNTSDFEGCGVVLFNPFRQPFQ